MSEKCPDCGRERTLSWRRYDSNRAVFCPMNLSREMRHDAWHELQCANGQLADLRAKLSASEAEVARLRQEVETESSVAQGLREHIDGLVAEHEAELKALRQEVELLRDRRFPVLGGGMSIPWQMLVPHEPQAVRNHGQTLQRLAERGGLSWAELLCVLESRRWDSRNWIADEVAKPRVLALVEQYEAVARLPPSPNDSHDGSGKGEDDEGGP